MFIINGITTDSQTFYIRMYHRKLTNCTDGQDKGGPKLGHHLRTLSDQPYIKMVPSNQP